MVLKSSNKLKEPQILEFFHKNKSNYIHIQISNPWSQKPRISYLDIDLKKTLVHPQHFNFLHPRTSRVRLCSLDSVVYRIMVNEKNNTKYLVICPLRKSFDFTIWLPIEFPLMRSSIFETNNPQDVLVRAYYKPSPYENFFWNELNKILSLLPFKFRFGQMPGLLRPTY